MTILDEIPRRTFWLWPIPLDERVHAFTHAACEPGWAWCRGGRWAATGVLCGALPAALALLLGVRGHQELSAALLLLPLWACIRRDEQARGMGLLAVAFFAHAAVVFAWAYGHPSCEAVLPGARGYWQKQWCWILSGWDAEYDAWTWVPAHILLAAAVVIYSFFSLGFVTLQQGFLQTDLMNYYSAQLAHASADGPAAVLLGWHLFSILRGIGYLFLTYEVASLSIERLSGETLSTRARRQRRWAMAFAFVLADAAVKAWMLEPLREGLYGNLRG